MHSEPDHNAAVAAFFAELESMPWFRNVGKPLPADTAKKLAQWEDWPGPEDSGIFELSQRHQSLYDEIMSTAGGRRQELDQLWNRVQQLVFRLVSKAVPFDPKADSWHAPTAAVWQATWTAGLMALCVCLRRQIPEDLQEQWKWFLLGHWPAGYSAVWADERLGPLLVY